MDKGILISAIDKGGQIVIRTYYLLFLYIVSILFAIDPIVLMADASEVGEWQAYGSDKASTKYVPLDQINKDNVKDLRIAWRWNSPDNALVESNPDPWTMVNEATSLNQVAAINPVTGETIWVYDPETYKDGTPTGSIAAFRGDTGAVGRDRQLAPRKCH